MLPDRFRRKYRINAESGCWEWKRPSPPGYGKFFWGGRLGQAHRFSYEWFRGVIPEGLEIDHVCRNRACVNPEHLRAVTHRENQASLIKTHCEKHGTVRTKGKCRDCNRETQWQFLANHPGYYKALARKKKAREWLDGLMVPTS